MTPTNPPATSPSTKLSAGTGRGTKRLWCIMKAHNWDKITVGGISMRPPPEGPHYFIPVFKTRKQALAWEQSGENLRELQTIPNDDDEEEGNLPSRNQGRDD